MDLLIEKPSGKPLLEVIAGSYEEFIIGYVLSLQSNQKAVRFFQNFSNHAHSGSVKCICSSANGALLVSGGTDEICHLINLKKRKELGNLIEQQGAITALQFVDKRYLLSASEDCSICVWDTRDWDCVKKLVGHLGSITGLAPHPSGKLLLSTAKDRTVRTWNLIQGRCSFVTNLKEPAQQVCWSLNGEDFLLVYGKRVDAYNISNCGVWLSLDYAQGINCVRFLTKDVLAIGAEDESIILYDLSKRQELFTFKAHERRVKDIQLIASGVLPDLPAYSEASDICICSASSDGFVKLWSINLIAKEHKLLAEINSKCRLNCLTVSVQMDTESKEISKQLESVKNVQNDIDQMSTKMQSAKKSSNKKRKIN